jgi:D-alanyl-lipoteichoic acid acyltransferase DltB (MBOAT superfamily)
VAGPIERAQHLIPQLVRKKVFNRAQTINGLQQMLWGFFKKLVIADRLSIYVDAVYNNAEHHTGTSLLIATVFFAFQIYCDFSGYSDIAIGSARVLGIDLMINFKRPYLSKSISEFWSRWHISLSTWFKDYFYISLGGNRVSIPRWYFNLFIVFLVSGIWHGANWTFVIWGGLNGIYLILAIMRDKVFKRKSNTDQGENIPINILNTLFTFILICFTWIFFRVSTVQGGFEIVKKIVFEQGTLFFDLDLVYGILCILFLITFEWVQENKVRKLLWMDNDSPVVRYFAYSLLLISIISFGVFDGGQFIYFQF